MGMYGTDHRQFVFNFLKKNRPIYSLILGSRVMIVLSSDVVARDLLDKKSAIYSSRPELFIGQTIGSGGLRLPFMPYSKTWRTLRRCLHTILNIRAAKSYAPYQDLENKQMLAELLDQPEDFGDHIQRYADSLTTQMAFGFRAISKEDEHIKELFENMRAMSELTTTTAAALLDVFPIIRHLPSLIVPVKKRALQLHLKEKAFNLKGWMEIKQQIRDGTAKQCSSVELFKAQEIEGFDDDLAAYTSGVFHEGGSGTTAAVLRSFIMAMLLFPEVQLKAREELDNVCGDRLPTVDDEKDLPYVRACVKEALRWSPILAMAVPHAVTKDDMYQGYKIPKGATVLLNTYAISRDPSRYENPRVYDPSRFLGDSTTAAESASCPDVSKRDHFAFGAGRRICPGMHIAEKSLFLGISRLLWGFDFSKAKRMTTSSDGKEIWEDVTPDQDDLTEGVLTEPVPFPASVTPRSELHARVIRAAWKDRQEVLDEKGQWKEVPEGIVLSGYTPTTDLGY
ncbi:hypothetical protein SLS53_005620 [Cytospora paraplurivora]|uniref:Cytochrome P450 n=1 Tax=Cytospora paraplurivora TaxID=2898453 RepID=A0AAN9U7G3_9PEZI